MVIPSSAHFQLIGSVSESVLGLVTGPLRIPLGMPEGGVGEGDARAGSLPLALSLLVGTTSSSSLLTSSTLGAGDQFLDLRWCLLLPRSSEDVSSVDNSPGV